VAQRLTALYRYAMVLTGNRHDAEDLVQEALTRTGLRWGAVRRKDDPEGYVRTAMVRIMANRWRRPKRGGNGDAATTAGLGPTVTVSRLSTSTPAPVPSGEPFVPAALGEDGTVLGTSPGGAVSEVSASGGLARSAGGAIVGADAKPRPWAVTGCASPGRRRAARRG
jgi:Sigma-70 region 2